MREREREKTDCVCVCLCARTCVFLTSKTLKRDGHNHTLIKYLQYVTQPWIFFDWSCPPSVNNLFWVSLTGVTVCGGGAAKNSQGRKLLRRHNTHHLPRQLCDRYHRGLQTLVLSHSEFSVFFIFTTLSIYSLAGVSAPWRPESKVSPRSRCGLSAFLSLRSFMDKVWRCLLGDHLAVTKL